MDFEVERGSKFI